MSVTDPQIHTLIGAYVCDALDPAERAAFEAHVLECASCREEVAQLREAAAALGAATATDPPDRLRAAVNAAIATTPQERSVVTPITAARRRRHRGWVTVAGWAAAAALAGVVAALSVVISGQGDRIDASNAQVSSLTSLLSAPDVHSSVGQVGTGGAATVVDSRSRDEAAIILTGLAGLPADKVYQLWMIGPAGMRSGGLVPGGAGGVSVPILLHGLADTRSLALTIEPARGSAQPTTAPILTLAISG